MLHNTCTGIYKFGNNIYPRHIRRRQNLGHIYRGGKSASYVPGNTVHLPPPQGGKLDSDDKAHSDVYSDKHHSKSQLR
jgi:hypothetical protein